MAPRQTITLTFRDCAEDNLGGGSKIGSILQSGMSPAELEKIAQNFEETQFVNLNEYLPENLDSDQAAILIIRNGVN